jgi:CRP-like cAMP-binding protein
MIDGNNLLAALRDADRLLLEPHLVEISLPGGTVLCEAGEEVQFCWLPRHNAVASFVVTVDSGHAVEMAIVGREGALGGIVSHGLIPAYARATVMHGGSFYRLSAADLERAKQASPSIRFLFCRYADCLLAQVFQSVACNASHTIVQRAAKWLCAAVDRTGGSEIAITQDQFASLLGVGRSYASRVVQVLKREGMVSTRRGGLMVRDRDALVRAACGCNDHVREHFATVLSGVYPQTA